MMFVAYKLLSKKEKCVLCVSIYRDKEKEMETDIGRDYRCGKNVLKYVLVFQLFVRHPPPQITKTRIPSIKTTIIDIIQSLRCLGLFMACNEIFGRLQF